MKQAGRFISKFKTLMFDAKHEVSQAVQDIYQEDDNIKKIRKETTEAVKKEVSDIEKSLYKKDEE